ENGQGAIQNLDIAGQLNMLSSGSIYLKATSGQDYNNASINNDRFNAYGDYRINVAQLPATAGWDQLYGGLIGSAGDVIIDTPFDNQTNKTGSIILKGRTEIQGRQNLRSEVINLSESGNIHIINPNYNTAVVYINATGNVRIGEITGKDDDAIWIFARGTLTDVNLVTQRGTTEVSMFGGTGAFLHNIQGTWHIVTDSNQ